MIRRHALELTTSFIIPLVSGPLNNAHPHTGSTLPAVVLRIIRHTHTQYNSSWRDNQVRELYTLSSYVPCALHEQLNCSASAVWILPYGVSTGVRVFRMVLLLKWTVSLCSTFIKRSKRTFGLLLSWLAILRR